MAENKADKYFDVEDPIRDFVINRSEEETDSLLAFIKAISDEEMTDYQNRAFENALKWIQSVGPRIVSAVPDLDLVVKREMLDELFEGEKWRLSRRMIIDDFLKEHSSKKG